MRSSSCRRRQIGFSLVELMVAITIGLIILAAVATIFVNAGRTHNNQERFARVQENGRFAMYYLTKDLHAAGYFGCMKDPTRGEAVNPSDPSLIGRFKNNLDTTSGLFYGATNLTTPVDGIDNASTSATPSWGFAGVANMPSNALSGTSAANSKTDLLLIRLADTASSTNLTARGTTNPTIASTSSFKSGDIVLISDCDKAEMFRITAIASSTLTVGTTCTSLTPATPCNSTSQFTKQYDTAATVMKLTTHRYYVGTNANGNPSLYRDVNGASAVELVEGIESLQILYGLKDPSSTTASTQPVQYKKASTMVTADWSNVVSVKIGILARTTTDKDMDVDNNTYDVNGTTIGPFNDRNSRRVFTATVLLKNRIN